MIRMTWQIAQMKVRYIRLSLLIQGDSKYDPNFDLFQQFSLQKSKAAGLFMSINYKPRPLFFASMTLQVIVNEQWRVIMKFLLGIKRANLK